uniref:EOG090X03B7 n=1 Tax=Daphnia hispanica TaxID=575233 RepID=A0A4Y7M7R5_9CRUS|nr:EOG090X03B7 [Daphnia hispanica]
MSFPDKEKRQKCWDSRDRYWECLDKSGDQLEKCMEVRAHYETTCPSQWVKHFDRKREYLKFKERIQNDGCGPLFDSERSERVSNILQRMLCITPTIIQDKRLFVTLPCKLLLFAGDITLSDAYNWLSQRRVPHGWSSAFSMRHRCLLVTNSKCTKAWNSFEFVFMTSRSQLLLTCRIKRWEIARDAVTIFNGPVFLRSLLDACLMEESNSTTDRSASSFSDYASTPTETLETLLQSMTVGPLITEITCTFIVAASILYRYGDWFRHHIIVTLSVLVAWYFSFLIIFILPLDVTSTAYRQCIQEHTLYVEEPMFNETTNLSTTAVPHIIPSNETSVCKLPWSYVPENVLPQLWRVLYWTSQFLTWFVLPLMQSYTKAGDFTVKGKLKSSLIDNAIYYGSYLVIATILLIYLAAKPDFEFDWPKLKAIAASASNTWGLFWLVLLLGYGLVDIPRSVWRSAIPGPLLSRLYFKAAKLNAEKSEAEENLEDYLEALQVALTRIPPSNPLRKNADTISDKLPLEWRERMKRKSVNSNQMNDSDLNEKSLVRLHRQVIRALQRQHRTETQWYNLVEKIFDLEDVHRNIGSHEHYFKASFEPIRSTWVTRIHSPTIEWYWKCLLRRYVCQGLAMILALLSVLVVWSELTFFNASPVLSIFAIFVNLAKEYYDYLSIELVSIATIAYMCVCAYSTVLKIRVLNLYYLAPHHQTDEYSLIFSGMLLCRLTPPMCLNFLGLIHMDSHIIKARLMETYYTQIMGHMDVLPIISNGFNIYFPMAILGLCLATYFSLGARFLTFIGFQQFVDDEDDITADLADEGRELIKREKRRRQRAEDTDSRRRNVEVNNSARAERSRETGGLLVKRESSRSELFGSTSDNMSNEDDRYDQLFMQASRRIGDDVGSTPATSLTGSTDYRSSYTRSGPAPPRNFFDDV